MGDQTYVEARQLFEKYNGSHFQMEREGEYQKYKEYRVPKEIEMVWISELKNNTLKKLHTAKLESEIAWLFSRYSEMVRQTTDEKGLLLLLEFAAENLKKWDYLTNVRVIESILNSVKVLDKEYRQHVVNESLTLLKKVANTRFRVSDSYKENGVFPDYITESRIVGRLHQIITYWEDEIKL